MYSLVGGLILGSSGSGGCLIDWYYCSSYGDANPFSSFSPFPNSSTGILILSPMVSFKHLHLYLSGYGTASQHTAISGSCQQALQHFLFKDLLLFSFYSTHSFIRSFIHFTFWSLPLLYPSSHSPTWHVPLPPVTRCSPLPHPSTLTHQVCATLHASSPTEVRQDSLGRGTDSTDSQLF
jgi:hypothetical protein